MPAPDFARLEKLSREVDGLVRAGKWTKTEYRRVRKLALAAAGPDLDRYPGLLEFLTLSSDPTW